MLNLPLVKVQHAKALHDCEAIMEAAKGRSFTEDEQKAYDAALELAEKLNKPLARQESDESFTKALEKIMGGSGSDGAPRIMIAPGQRKSLGQQFVEDPAMQEWFKTKGQRPQHWVSPSVELKTLLTEDPASGGALVQPQYLPGIIAGPPPVIAVAQLIAPGTVDSNMISYMVETSFTNNANAVLEGGVKPESALTFSAKQDPVRKIAHWLPATEEILEDQPQLRSYIDARLEQGVNAELDDEILNGTGVAPELLGFLVMAGLAPPVAQGTDTASDAIAKQIAAITLATGVAPTGIVLNPSDWLFLALQKNKDGDYVGSGPFAAAVTPTLWGLPVAVTPKMPAGTGLVGGFRTASQLFKKGGIRVETSNSHQDFFIKNLVVIRAEQRAALAVYRPAAFGKVTGLAPTAP